MSITKDDVAIFADYAVYARSVYMHSRTLYDCAQAAEKETMAKCAPTFFGDLNKVLIEYVILQACKITDPAKDVHKNESHTIEFFVQNADFSAEPAKSQQLTDIEKRMRGFRKKIKPARNKIISHTDRDAALSCSIMGAATDAEWSQFWRDLDEFVAIMYEKYIGSPPIQILAVSGITDTVLLKNALKKSRMLRQTC
jgi:hypothetical protein